MTVFNGVCLNVKPQILASFPLILFYGSHNNRKKLLSTKSNVTITRGNKYISRNFTSYLKMCCLLEISSILRFTNSFRFNEIQCIKPAIIFINISIGIEFEIEFHESVDARL